MKKPNIVLIYADDLGRGMLSCYGQTRFSTPNMDRIAREGTRAERCYGGTFCAPARASLSIGLHECHAGRWTFNIANLYHDYATGVRPLQEIYDTVNSSGIQPQAQGQYLAAVVREAGYVTGQIGKLEWGFSTSPQELEAHGWDFHYGYYDHKQCHGYYPPFVFENGAPINIEGNTRTDFGMGSYHDREDGTVDHHETGCAVHSQDLYDAKISEFIGANAQRSFLLYHPTQLPHGPVYYPDIFPEVAANPDLNQAEKEFASMVLRLDQTVGHILAELEKHNILEDTLIVLTSDNGHSTIYQNPRHGLATHERDGTPLDQRDRPFYSDTCGDVFDGNDGMAGLKVTNWEGGARVPFLAMWRGQIPAQSRTDNLLANYDLLATFAQAAGVELWAETDGVSMLPALCGREDAPQHDEVIFASTYGPCLITRDGWKLRLYFQPPDAVAFGNFGESLEKLNHNLEYQLYYLPEDYREARNLATDHPERVRELKRRLLNACDGNFLHGTPQAHFSFSL